MNKYTIQDFLSSKIALDVNEKDRPEFNRLMDEAGMKWACGHEASKHDWFPCLAENKVLRWSRGGLPVVNFSDLTPADLWAEFCAGKCYLRVKKEEWAEFAKRCIEAGMCWERSGLIQPVGYRGCLGGDGDYFTHGDGKFLNGYNINTRDDMPVIDFSTLLPAPAKAPEPPAPYDGRGKHKVGDLFEVAGGDNFNVGDIIRLYDDDGSICPKFERLSDGEQHYKIWRNLKPYIPAPSPRIEITVAGRVTTATLYEDGKAVRTGTATCAPEDEFEFVTSAVTAFNRMRFGQHTKRLTRSDMERFAAEAAALAARMKEALK